MAAEYPDIRTDQYHIDILTAHFVRHPDWFDGLWAQSFWRYLSDWGQRSLDRSVSPFWNLNPEKEFPSMFEPCTLRRRISRKESRIRSASWSGAMMLRHLWRFGSREAVERSNREFCPIEGSDSRYWRTGND